jgi:hypothetical protein
MHITKISAGNEFYATAWCGEKLGMLDSCYLSVDNALKAIENKVGFPCQQCLSAVIAAAQQSAQPTLLIEREFEITCQNCGSVVGHAIGKTQSN